METERQKQLRRKIHEIASAIADFCATDHMPMNRLFYPLSELKDAVEEYFNEIPSSELSKSEQDYLRDSMMRHAKDC